MCCSWCSPRSWELPWDHAALTSVLSFQDEKYAVTVYKRVLQNERRCWEHLAGLHSHYKPIRSILFGIQLDGSEPRLLSLGEDRQLVRPWESSTGDLGLRWGWRRVRRDTQPVALQLPISSRLFVSLALGQICSWDDLGLGMLTLNSSSK